MDPKISVLILCLQWYVFSTFVQDLWNDSCRREKKWKAALNDSRERKHEIKQWIRDRKLKKIEKKKMNKWWGLLKQCPDGRNKEILLRKTEVQIKLVSLSW